MTGQENEPLLRDAAIKSYDDTLVKPVDEERSLNSRSSSQSTIKVQDENSLASKRLGEASLTLIASW